MSKARGDLLLPIRTVEEVRNVRCAAIQRVPSVIPDQLQCFCPRYRDSNAGTKEEGWCETVVPMAITGGVDVGYRFGTQQSIASRSSVN